MNPPWPSFWAHVREEDRPALREVLVELLGAGALFGESGRDRELFLVAREYQRELAEYLSPLNIELVPDPGRPLLQARPIPGECGLTARFTKDETLVVLTLWRIYDEARMERPVQTVLISANELHARLRLYFPNILPPTETHLERIISRLRARRFIRFQRHEDPARFGESAVEILPTLARAIPFESQQAWAEQADLYRQNEGGGSAEEEKA